MTNLNRIEYIIGIDLGITTSGVSIAHLLKASDRDDLKKSSPKFLSSVLYQKDGNNTPLCGIRHDDIRDLGVYVANIGQYLFDIDASNEKLGQMMDGLTLKKVISDYLKYFVQLAHKRLQIHDKVIKNIHFEEFVNEEFIDEDIKTICYCLVCPADRQGFMKDCFIEAGIIEESEAEYRLLFTTKAVATAHCQLSLDRYVTGIQNNQSYLVCDVGHISIGIAKMHAASTESFSSVTTISDNLAYGVINLRTKFKDYLIENMTELNLNLSLLAQLVDKFSEIIKYGFSKDFSEEVVITQNDANGNLIKFTYEELNRIVFKEFIDSVIEYILNAVEAHRPCKLYISGQYGADTYFFKNLKGKYEGEVKHCIFLAKSSLDTISSGAVSSILIPPVSSQIPLFDGEQVSTLKNRFEEPIENVNGNDAYHFIVGIDFGTTFSGCSYVQLKDRKGESMATENIKTIKENWLGGNLLKFGKTPTLLMYDKKMKPKFWGEEARIQAKRHKELNLLGNFKLFLCPESSEKIYSHTNDLEELKDQRGFGDDEASKTEVHAVKVIASYLKLFKNHVVEHIFTKEMNENFGFFTRPKLLKKYKIRYVITVPAMWNASARDTMAQAAIEATIIKKNEIDQLLIISEPEAAALYCEKRFTEYFNSLEGNINDTNFIVCDAGGGTVDLVTFNLQVNEKKESTICQIGDGVGDICGSTYLDVRFKDYLFDFYKSFGVNIDTANIQLDDVMQEFIKTQKPNFMPNLQGDSFYDINLPGKSVINFSNSSNYRMSNDNKTLKMKNQDMKEKIFDPIVDRIFYLIDNQFKQARARDSKIDAIFMVGGFSQSRYLQKRIKDQYKSVCHVSVPSGGVTAISHGAVSYALNPGMISRRSAGQSIGLEVQAPYIKSLADSSEKRAKGPNGDWNFEKDRLEYFVMKGQFLKDGQQTVYQKDVYVLYPNAAVIAIFSCDSKDAKNRYLTKSHVKIAETKIIMPLIDGIDGKLVHFTVSLQTEHIGVSVTIECQDQLINAEVRRISKNQRTSLKIKHNLSLNVPSSTHPLVSYCLKNINSLFNYGRFS